MPGESHGKRSNLINASNKVMVSSQFKNSWPMYADHAVEPELLQNIYIKDKKEERSKHSCILLHSLKLFALSGKHSNLSLFS